MHMRLSIFALTMVIASATGMPSGLAQPASLTIFAAASMKSALDDINLEFSKRTGGKPVASYAATPALVRQLEQGAPADIFVSADVTWMDYAQRTKHIAANSRIDLLGNRLVLIAATNAKLTSVTLVPKYDLAKLLGDGGRIAIGEAKSVPAGRYAAAALQQLGIWPSVEKRLAMVENVRVALALVARGEADLGIVYETDARAEPGVKIIGQFPSNSHPAIVYSAAATVGAKPDTARYLAFLQSRAARAIFERHGFAVLIEPSS
jgi:molybdate transport system substrate-binding protein